MAGQGDSLRAELAALPVVDAHEHMRGHEQCQPRECVTDFVISCYLGSLLPFADRALAAAVQDSSRPDRERWRDFVKIWPLVRCTGYGALVARMLGQWGIGDCLDETSYDFVRDKLQERSPASSQQAYAGARIEKSVTHYLAHPCCGGIENVDAFLKGTLSFEHGFYPLLGTLPLHEFASTAGIEIVGKIADVAIGSLAALVDAVAKIAAAALERGVVGFKDHAAYSRGLSFGAPDQSAAEAELAQLLKGEEFAPGAPALSDYVFHQIVQLSIDHRMPMVIHTGYLVGCADPKANVRHFTPILEAYPDARFDLYHLNYPWFEDLLAVLKRFPNTWANCCWTHIIDPAGTVQFLRSALTTVPANHVFGFGGDTVEPYEAVLAHLGIARENIAIVLEEAVVKGWCSAQTALDIARRWLYQNPSDFYGL